MISHKYMPLIPESAALNDAIGYTEQIIQSTFKHAPRAISDITRHLNKSMGKGIRPMLLLSSAMDTDGKVPAAAIKAAAAVEILHMATLVHDDIIDDAPLRRGQASVQHQFGKKKAVIAGDYLFCVAFYTISTIYEPYVNLLPDFAKSIGRICLGEMAQNINIFNPDISYYDYLKAISGKTAALFRLCTHGGAVLAGYDEKQIRDYARFGNYLGMIFQIMDDCKDYIFSEETALKPVKSDLSAGIVTLPLLYAMDKEPAVKDKVQGFFSSETKSPQAGQEIMHWVIALGGIEKSKQTAAKYYEKANRILKKLHSTNPFSANALQTILDRAFNLQ